MPGAAALQAALLRRPRLASGAVRLLTAPGVSRLVAGTWSLYWNGLVDGASPRPAAWAGAAVQQVASRLGRRWPAARQLAAAPGQPAAAVPGGPAPGGPERGGPGPGGPGPGGPEPGGPDAGGPPGGAGIHPARVTRGAAELIGS